MGWNSLRTIQTGKHCCSATQQASARVLPTNRRISGRLCDWNSAHMFRPLADCERKGVAVCRGRLSASVQRSRMPSAPLAAGRTFWEKATLLHMWYHAPPNKKLRDRQSRHYYDVVQLYEHELGQAAVENTELLLSVARHKQVFFPAAWARYSDAEPGTLRLVPKEVRRPELEAITGRCRR